ncbi:MAG: DUF11 domain-containing protein [Micavibrio sp.]|nr:MAG: DUF11 domain-containing protein [Micavibrio sp.]
MLQKTKKIRRNIAASLLSLVILLWSGTAFADLGASVTLVTGQPTDIYPGEVTQLEITLSNNNVAAPITSVAFSNSLPGTLPNGLEIAGAASYTCTDPAIPSTDPGLGTLTATVGTQAISLSGGGIPARANNMDGTCTIIIPVTAGTTTGDAATYSYTIADGAVTGDDGGAVANSGSVSQSVNVRAFARPTISKSFSSNTLVLGGSASTLTITVNNSNPVPLSNFSVTDNFPQLGGTNIIEVANPVVSSSNCTGGGTPPTFTPVAGAASVSATGGTIAAESNCTVTVDVVATYTNGAYQTSFQSNTIVGATDFSSDIGIIPSNASANVRTRSPLNLSKNFANSAISSGESDTFSIVMSNTGTSPLVVDGFMDDPIDGIGDLGFGLKISGPVGVSCTGAGIPGTYAATAGDTGITQTANTTIAAGGSCTITAPFTATVQTPNTPISYTNTIPQGAVSTTTPGVVSQNSSSAILVVDDLRILKSRTPSSAAPGSPVRYTVTVQNWSSSAIANLEISENLTNGQTFLTSIIGGTDFTPTLSGAGCAGLSVTGATGTTTPVFTITTVPARIDINTPGACDVTFWAMTDPGAANGSNYTNVLGAGSVCYNGGATCNGGASNSVSGTVNTAVASASKSFSPSGPLSEGAITQMTITLSNISANPLTDVTLTDNLPIAGSGGQMRVATPANAATTCAGGSITAAPDSTSVTLNNATVPARAGGGTGAAGTCVVQVDVVAPAGSYSNTATIAGNQTYADGTTAGFGPTNSNTANLVYTSSLGATKSFSPASVSSGGQSRVTIRMVNSGAVALSNVSVTDPLPGGMVLATPINANATCAGSPVITGNPGDGSITMTGANLAGGGTCDLLFDVVATGGADWVNTIPVGNLTADGGVSNQTAITGTLTFDPPTNLTVAKTTNPGSLTFPGQVSRLTITINNGTLDVTGLSLTDYFTTDGTAGAADNGMVVAPTPAASTTCTGGTVTAVPGGTSVALSGASLPASASCTIEVNVSSVSVGGITNFIPVGAIQTNQGLTNSGQATTSLTVQSNVGITKQFTPNVVAVGERSRLRITLYNATLQPASDISVTDNLPANVTVPSSPNPTTTCAGGTITAPTAGQVQISGANLGPADGAVPASCISEIDVVAGVEGDFLNTIPAGAVTATVGGAAATNSEPSSDTLRAKSPLEIHKAIDGQTLDAGNPAGFTTGTATRAPGVPATLTVHIANSNSAPLTSASFTDNLPTGLVVGTTPAASTTCAGGTVNAAPSATSIGLSGATIPASGSCTVSVNVLSNISGSYTNTIPAGALTTFEGVTNDEPTNAQIFVSTPPTVSKQFSPAVIPQGGTSTMTIFLGNDNGTALTLTSVFTDNLPTAPGAVLVAAVPNVSTTCPGAVTASAGASSISYANGAQVPAGGCSISVDVTAATAGDHTNNIPAGALQTDFGNNQQPDNAVLSVSTLGFISGKMFRDNNIVPDGVFQSGTDTPISGEAVELRSGATCGGVLLDTQLTDAAGNYLFSGLAGGTYSVCQNTQPAATSNGITTAGAIISVNGSTGTAGTASNPTATSSQITNIILNDDGAGGEVSGSTGNNFAEVVLSGISGTVFRDANNNGIQDGGDTGIAGQLIELLDASDNVIATDTTDGTGAYSFTGLEPGTYSVRQPNQPAGTSNGITTAGPVANGGTAGTPTGPTTVPSVIASIVLPPNTIAADNNFAEIINGRSVLGTVFLDYNNDGVLNGDEYGLSNQTINLTGTDINGNPVSATTVTNANGDYSFTEIPPGTYTLDQPTQPPGTTNGIVTAGSTGGVASNPTPTTSRIENLDLTGANTISGGNNFAEVPGAVPDLTIAKTHAPSSFGEGSTTGVFTITPSNIGTVDTSGTVTIVDTLPAGMTVAAPATGTGWTCIGGIGDTTVTCTSTDVIAAGSSGNPISLRVAVAAGTSGQLLVNTVVISGGGEPPGFDGNNTATDTVAIADVADISGTVWRDFNHNRQIDAGEPRVEGWTVELVFNNIIVSTTTTAADGTYAFTGVAPGSGYSIRFREPTTGQIYGRALPNEQGIAPDNGTRDTGAATSNNGTNAGNPAGADISSGNGILNNLSLLAGDNIIEQSLPLDPAGVVYDSITRQPIAGADVTISGPAGFNPALHLVGGTATVTTAADGFYQFLLTPAAPAGTYTLSISNYPGAYIPVPSTIIPVCGNTLTVSPLPDPALVHTSALAPDLTAPDHNPGACPASTAAFTPADQATTQHYFSFVIDPATSADLVNNHIPLDPVLDSAIFLTKTTPMTNVSIGQLVPYTITARNTLAANLTNIDIIDTIPPGFKYKTGSATLDGVATEPTIVNRTLTWPNLTIDAGATREIKILLVVGSGVQTGEYVNRVQAINNLVPPGFANAASNVATATVRVVPDPVFDCSDLIGKVFDDKNRNGYQDEGEPGLPGVRVATVNGLLVTTDAHGRFHVACADVPDSDRGSNFIMKLDERTLPTGYRMTTENPRIIRVTRGKMAKINFGAAIHKVVRVDMHDGAFLPGTTELKQDFRAQLEQMLEQMRDRPIVLRLGYEMRQEEEVLARNRLRTVSEEVTKLWKRHECCHKLQVEEEFVTSGAGGRR